MSTNVHVYVPVYVSWNGQKICFSTYSGWSQPSMHSLFTRWTVVCTSEAVAVLGAGSTKMNVASCRIEGSPGLDLFTDKMAMIWSITVWNDSMKGIEIT